MATGFLWVAVRARTAAASLQDSPATSSVPLAGLRGQSQDEAQRRSVGCVSCHTSTDEPSMHPTKTVQLACIDCHGGDASASVAVGIASNSAEYNEVKEKAHVHPKNAAFKMGQAVPERAFTAWLNESYEFIKFVNPGDLRVAPETCGSVGCHASETRAVSTSMMTHAGMLWGAALYNNGGYPTKNTRFGQRRKRLARKECFRGLILFIAGKLRSRAMCCGCSNEAAARKAKLAIRSRRMIRVSPKTS
jgi:hypothetical protein